MKNDNAVIKELKKLKTLRATPQWGDCLRTDIMKKTAYASSDKKSRKNFLWNLFLTRWTYAFGIVAIVWLQAVFFHESLSYQGQRLAVKVNIFVADNAYERSLVLLQALHYRMNEFSSKKINGHEIAYVKVAIEENSKQLGMLQLQGEEGQYTQEQCFSVYQQYDQQLRILQEAVNTRLRLEGNEENRKDLLDLQLSIYDAIEDAEYRLGMYP